MSSFVPPAAEDHPWSLLLTVLLVPVSLTNSSIANPCPEYTHNESFLGAKIKWYILTAKGYLGEATER
ncbi:hypothetical protein [Zooshikella ganghwensis]|uniref:hypothetical protein n=1 Tax=Zooshikella ganghwensis TaxID=202772 RepID=UPI0004152F4C|nr:hypothetical protein [Zooshikella ganghwensis]